MKQKTFFMSLLATLVATTGVLTSCNQLDERGADLPNVDKKLTVTTESYFLEEDGSLTPLGNLRAVTGDATKGSVVGDGVYDYNASVKLSVTAKSNYTLYKFYESSGKGGFSEAKGVVNKASHTVTFNVQEDMKFIAIFASPGTSLTLGYQNLKLDNKLANYAKTLSGNTATSGNFMSVGEEIVALKDPSGKPTGQWTVRNAAYKAWGVSAPSAAWLKASINTSTGQVTYNAQAYNQKAPARTATFKVGKDGASGKSAWRTVTITQNSYYEGTGADETDITKPTDDQFTYGDGTVANIKATLATSLPATGGSKDLKTLDKSLNTTVYMLVPVYINGVKQAKTSWVKKPLTVTWSAPAATWLSGTNSVVKAGINNTSAARSTTVTASFKLGSVVVKTTTITVSQAKRQYNVDVEIQ